MTQLPQRDLHQLLAARYSDAPKLDGTIKVNETLEITAARGSCRAFLQDPVPEAMQDLLCAAAMAAPTKSDLQQRDIILLRAPEVRREVAALVSGQPWVAQAPMMAVFCGNNRRQRLLHHWQNVPFANDHLDALFNAVGDAAIALGAFVAAAEAQGLGCCPISAVRNEAAAVSRLLHLPDHVFPFAGLAFGFPKDAPTVSKRLPLGVTCHVDRYQEEGLQQAVEAYDADRAATQPYNTQRFPELFGETETYGWSQDKVRQYSQQERQDFGAFVRAKGFDLS